MAHLDRTHLPSVPPRRRSRSLMISFTKASLFCPNFIPAPPSRAYTRLRSFPRGTRGSRPSQPRGKEAVPEESARDGWTERSAGSKSRLGNRGRSCGWCNGPELRGSWLPPCLLGSAGRTYIRPCQGCAMCREEAEGAVISPRAGGPLGPPKKQNSERPERPPARPSPITGDWTDAKPRGPRPARGLVSGASLYGERPARSEPLWRATNEASLYGERPGKIRAL